jgi:Holliday junction resolvase RusA-like endonuclease
VISFFVEGKPQTAGSKVAIRPGVVVESGDRKAKQAWREDVRSAAREALEAYAVYPSWSRDGPFSVTMVFQRRRPKGHFGTGRNSGELKATAPAFPSSRPDVLKLARATEDALTGIVWNDDASIVMEYLEKVFDVREGVRVSVQTLDTTVSDGYSTGLPVPEQEAT